MDNFSHAVMVCLAINKLISRMYNVSRSKQLSNASISSSMRLHHVYASSSRPCVTSSAIHASDLTAVLTTQPLLHMVQHVQPSITRGATSLLMIVVGNHHQQLFGNPYPHPWYLKNGPNLTPWDLMVLKKVNGGTKFIVLLFYLIF